MKEWSCHIPKQRGLWTNVHQTAKSDYPAISFIVTQDRAYGEYGEAQHEMSVSGAIRYSSDHLEPEVPDK